MFDSLLLPAPTLLIAALAGMILSGLAALWVERRILPTVAFVAALAGFASAPFAPSVAFSEYGLQSLLFDIGVYGVMFAAGGVGWWVSGRHLTASLFSLGATSTVWLASPLWQLALACGILRSCL